MNFNIEDFWFEYKDEIVFVGIILVCAAIFLLA